MRILRGVMLGVGLVMVFLAACADQWEPGRILAVGFTGLGLCAAGKLMPDTITTRERRKSHAPQRSKAVCRTNTETGRRRAG